VCCWYNESLNGLALLNSFEDSGDQDAGIKGYAGMMSVMHNVLPDGMGFNQFICTAGEFSNTSPRTFESGTGLWGFLQAAKSYVVNDESFGLIGYGCQVETSAQGVSVVPKDGVRKRVRFIEDKIDVECAQGEITGLTWNKERHALDLQIADPTGLVKTAALAVRGLEAGNYKVSSGGTKKVDANGVLPVSAPMSARRIRVERA
jgi:hypothetical protein